VGSTGLEILEKGKISCLQRDSNPVPSRYLLVIVSRRENKGQIINAGRAKTFFKNSKIFDFLKPDEINNSLVKNPPPSSPRFKSNTKIHY